jgi:hypothetical protein
LQLDLDLVPTGVKIGCNQKIVVVEMAIEIWSPFFLNPFFLKNKKTH